MPKTITFRKAGTFWADPTPRSRALGSVCVFPLVALFSFLAIPAIGQNPEGSIVGTVKDPSGGRVPNAYVTASSVASGARRKTEANTLGEYRFDFLPPGRYRVEATAKSFQRIAFEVSLATGFSQTIDFALPIN